MPLCPVCGGNIAANDRHCPYCGKTQLRLGDPPRDTSEWDLPLDDSLSGLTAQPAPRALAPEPPAPGSDNSILKDDWLLPEALLEPPAAQPSAPGDVSLPPWSPVSAPEPAPPPPSPFDFEFDLDGPAPEPPSAPTPAPVADFQPPPVLSPVPVTPMPVAPVPVIPIPVTPVATPALIAPVPVSSIFTAPPPAPPPAPAPLPVGRVCPACGKTFGPEYNDTFCLCGAELTEAAPPPAPPPAPAPPPEAPAKHAAPQRPPAGTRCLVLYGVDKQPVHYFALSKDATLVGRLDAASGCFPEIDVSEHVDEATARKVSRKHALILRSRSSDSFTLRPLPGNTGTQVEKRMLSGPEEVPLTPGTRVILGGAVRFKFEVT
jgi:hypothetical protein